MMSRFVLLPSKPDATTLFYLKILSGFACRRFFFLGYDTYEGYVIKVTRDAEFDIDTDIDNTYTQKIEKALKNRKEENLYVLFTKGN